MSRRLPVKAICSIALLMLIGCSSSLKEVQEPIDPRDIHGLWALDESASAGKFPGIRPQMEFLADGRCQLSAIPVNEALVKWTGRRVSEAATWKIGKGVYDETQVEITLANGTGIDFEIMKDRSDSLVLVHPLRQPDDAESLVLRKLPRKR